MVGLEYQLSVNQVVAGISKGFVVLEYKLLIILPNQWASQEMEEFTVGEVKVITIFNKSNSNHHDTNFFFVYIRPYTLFMVFFVLVYWL